jgi:hypothetical protein
MYILAYDYTRISEKVYSRFRFVDEGTYILNNMARHY